MGSIRITDSRVQEEISAAKMRFRAEAQDVLPYISAPDQAALEEDDGWHDLLAIIALTYRLYGLPVKETVRMAALMSLLRCSAHLHRQVEDGMQGLDRQVQYRLLVGDQLMARALALLARDNAHTLIGYFSGLVIRVSEGMVRRLEIGRSDRLSVAGTDASWYEAVFYSAAHLAGRTEEQQVRAGKLGFKLGMLAETLRQSLPMEEELLPAPPDWAVLPDGLEKETLICYAREIKTALSSAADKE